MFHDNTVKISEEKKKKKKKTNEGMEFVEKPAFILTTLQISAPFSAIVTTSKI